MNYEQRYKEALKAVKELQEANPSDDGIQNWVNEKFPELKVSEDEKIREILIEFFEDWRETKSHLWGINVNDILAWLEKLKVFAEHGDGLYHFGDNGFTYVGNPTWDNVSWLEKPCAQKPAEKAETKFHIGDWVIWDNKVICYIDNIYQGKESLMYTITDTNNMIRSYSVKSFDNNARHWTIQDAKDGDVLADEYGIYIFNSFDSSDDKLFICKCAYEYSKKTFEFGEMLCKKTDVYPASKDQRDLLFQKMHEAGYMWDSKSKQLLSLKAEPSGKQKPAGWSEEDERMYQNMLNPSDLRPQSHWKPSQEQMYMLEWLTTNVLDDGVVGNKAKEVLYTLIEQLKSL